MHAIGLVNMRPGLTPQAPSQSLFGVAEPAPPEAAKPPWQTATSDVRRAVAKSWKFMAGFPRRVRIAAGGYLVVLVFGIGAGLARLSGAEAYVSLITGLVLASPLVIALIGDRITGFKAFSFEVSLAEVAVATEGDFSSALMETAETGPSASPALLSTLTGVMQSRIRLMRVNLRNDDYWWSTRIFLLAALAADYTDVKGLVFVKSGDLRIFVGIAEPLAVRRGLATVFPKYETAYRQIRSEAISVPPKPPDRVREVSEILAYRWDGALQGESNIRQTVTSDNLKLWLKEELDTESLQYAPLNPLLRYRIVTRPHRFTALTDKGALVAIVDKEELAMRAAVAELEQRLQ